jgi:hypothetical protein
MLRVPMAHAYNASYSRLWVQDTVLQEKKKKVPKNELMEAWV